ncbi:MAG: hypothetical protein M0017_06810 [Desulfobacteraceae bacterium]|nr:hypothetical protein [Desulfobacteraceae bacterium]
MQKILIAEAAEGMVLARDVQTPEGRVLCGKGTELTASLIDRLKKMEVSHVAVEGHPLKKPGEKSLEEELRDIEERFSRVKNIPPLVYLKKRIMERAVAARRQ